MDVSEIEKALYSKLANDATLTSLLGSGKVFNSIIPADIALPALVFSLVSAVEDTETPRAVRAIYQVKAVADTLSDASAIAAQVDTVLQDATLTVTGMTNFYTACQEHIRYLEQGKQQNYGHAGADYLIWTEG